MGKGAVGPDNILIEVWMCLGEEGIRWLTNLFNVIWRTHRMPEDTSGKKRICCVSFVAVFLKRNIK